MVIFAAGLVYLSDSGKLAQISAIVKGPSNPDPTFSWSGFFSGLPNLWQAAATAFVPDFTDLFNSTQNDVSTAVGLGLLGG